MTAIAPLPPPDLVLLAHRAARAHALDPALVCAVVEQESSWDRWALRYEAGFYTAYIESKQSRGLISDETEARTRAFSWGLMQVMGEVAREHGFTGRSMAALCDPATGLDMGCRVLAAKWTAAQGNITQTLLLWNGGGNAGYPTEVMARLKNYAAVT